MVARPERFIWTLATDPQWQLVIGRENPEDTHPKLMLEQLLPPGGVRRQVLAIFRDEECALAMVNWLSNMLAAGAAEAVLSPLGGIVNGRQN